jgi:hypothetical protein
MLQFLLLQFLQFTAFGQVSLTFAAVDGLAPVIIRPAPGFATASA